MMFSNEDMSPIEDTFKPFVRYGTIRPIMSPQWQACPPSLERYQFSIVFDDSNWL